MGVRKRPGERRCAALFGALVGVWLGAAGCRLADDAPTDAPAPGEHRLDAGVHAVPSLAGIAILRGAGMDETRLSMPGDGPILDVAAGTRLEVSDLSILAGDGQTAVRVAGELVGRRLRIEGGSVAVRVEGGTVRIEEVTVVGATTGIEVRGGRLEAETVSVQDVAGPAFFGASGHLEGRGLSARGVDYGLLTRPDVTVAIDGLSVSGARFAGVALVGSTTRITDLSVEGRSRHGAILAGDLVAPLHLASVRLEDVGPVGLSLVRAPAEVRGIRVHGVSKTARGEDGACILVEGSTVTLHAVDLERCGGEGLAVLGGSVRVAGGRIGRTGESAVQGWRDGRVILEEVAVENAGPPSLAAHEGAGITVSGGAARGGIFADCAAGSWVRLGADVRVDGIGGPCVEGP